MGQCERCGSVVPPERHQYDCPNAPAIEPASAAIDPAIDETPHTDPYDAAVAYARQRGTDDGRDAYAECVALGIPPEDAAPDLSGEWADRMTGPELYRDALAAAGIDPETDSGDAFSDVCDAYEDAFYAARDDAADEPDMGGYAAEGDTCSRCGHAAAAHTADKYSGCTVDGCDCADRDGSSDPYREDGAR